MIARGSVPFQLDAGYALRAPSGPASPEPAPLLVLLHGHGMSGQSFLDLVQPSDDEAPLTVAPDGPYPFEKRRTEGIAIRYAWYLYTGDQAAFRSQLERSEAHLLRVLDAVARDRAIDPARTVLCGYSQGGYLAGFVAPRQRDRFAGLILISTRFKHEFLTAELSAGRVPPTLAIHSESDPATRWPAARVSLDLLVASGADLETHLHTDGHRLPADLGGVIGDWLRRKRFA